jgi:hypothetical protein
MNHQQRTESAKIVNSRGAELSNAFQIYVLPIKSVRSACGKYPFVISVNPKESGNFSRAMGEKLMESRILILHCGTQIDMNFDPVIITSGKACQNRRNKAIFRDVSP